MRVTLSDPALVKHAGRFVWLELDYDQEANQPFLARHGVSWTPAFYVLDPSDERVTASHFGGMTRAEVEAFLDRGEAGFRQQALGAADRALARGDQAAGQGHWEEAVGAYRQALATGGGDWPGRARALDGLLATLQTARQPRACAEAAAKNAPGMARDRSFASVVHTGLGCANQGGDEPWGVAGREVLEPLAAQALQLSTPTRDDRFELYQALMVSADARKDPAALASWGERWLEEIERVAPSGEDERSALDVARVDVSSLWDNPKRVLPALEASEKAMPASPTASQRLALVAEAAQRHDLALDAVSRGLTRGPGPVTRVALLLVRARALAARQRAGAAREALDAAAAAARQIGLASLRENSLGRIDRTRAELGLRAR